MPKTAIAMRRAAQEDLPALVGLLADDPLGSDREDPRHPPAPAYLAAFQALQADQNQYLAVAELDGGIVGMLQLSFIPGLAHQGAWRGQIESVRVASGWRRSGIGRQMFGWAVEECRRKGCGLVQLTTDATRRNAQDFYESIGFHPSHVGYKKHLRPGEAASIARTEPSV